MENPRIESLQKKIASLRRQIIEHPVYSVIRNTGDLKIFMEFHIYAVWDFMSLLKSLQNSLTCTTLPWLPVGSPEIRYLINEIVTGEESDVDAAGARKSHFELYLDAMHQAGAPTGQIDAFISKLKSGSDVSAALAASGVAAEAAAFVNYTFGVISSNKPHVQAAVFTFGREDLIPGMFHSIVQKLNKQFPENISVFNYYLERHIEVDGGHHSHLALQMTAGLCGDSDTCWSEAETAVAESLEKRIQLWNGVYNKITSGKKVFA